MTDRLTEAELREIIAGDDVMTTILGDPSTIRALAEAALENIRLREALYGYLKIQKVVMADLICLHSLRHNTSAGNADDKLRKTFHDAEDRARAALAPQGEKP